MKKNRCEVIIVKADVRASILIVYAIEHCSYAIGFWKGLLATGS